MKNICYWIALTCIGASLGAEDQFNYRETEGNDYGPEDWGQVTCDEVGECPGWPDGWKSAVGWELSENICQWCPEDTDHSCGLHRQSPIDLLRGDATTGHDTECYDYHWMAYEDKTCSWNNIVDNEFTPERNNFRIRRHALQILTPVDENGELQCVRSDGTNAFPRLDYSKGFPNWWHLSHTEITVPSEHFQEGKQYDAEVHLAHFYEIDHQRKMGIVAIFLEADPNISRWPFLDKLICQWREVEDRDREECELESVPAYPGCRNPTRGGGGGTFTTPSPTKGPSTAPPEPVTPTASPASGSEGGDNAPVVCSDYFGHPIIDLARICKAGGCCENPRSATSYCHQVYAALGDDVNGVCSDCCNPSREVGPLPPVHPVYPPIECTTVNNPFRMCKPNSCCEAGASSSSYCTGVFNTYGQNMTSICWYCCSEPIDIMGGRSAPIATPSPVAITSGPEPSPTPGPVVPATTPAPVPASNPAPLTGSSVTCSDYDGNEAINIARICKDGGCCDPIRSSTDQCHFVYEFFGDAMASVCSDCCNPSKQLAPAPSPHPTYPPIQCSLVNNPFRICKPSSCCETTASTSSYCQGVYDTYGDSMGSICWYCCSEPKEVDPQVISSSRMLEEDVSGANYTMAYDMTEDELSFLDLDYVRQDIFLPQGMYASELKMHPSNFEVNENLEAEYVAGLENYRNLRDEETEMVLAQEEGDRRLQQGDNYASVRYSPYQWMREVKTEFYFRYEGGQMVPPCFETVHYRVMKDPIRIHSTQLAELERLLAWRIAPKGSDDKECKEDTAGRPRGGSDGNAVDLNRPLQSYSNIHRKVFCECDDWNSKFQEDDDWCLMDEDTRWYSEPYNFDTGGSF